MEDMSDEEVNVSLAWLGAADDTWARQDLGRFRHRLRQLRDDPAEAARIDALAAEAGPPEGNPRRQASPAWEDFTSFYRDVYSSAVRFLMTSTRASRADAEDAVQDAMFQACGRWDDTQSLPSPGRWLFTTARDLFIRQRMTMHTGESRDTVEQLMAEGQLRTLARIVLSGVPDSERQIDALVNGELSPREVADLLGPARAAIWSQLGHALKQPQEVPQAPGTGGVR